MGSIEILKKNNFKHILKYLFRFNQGLDLIKCNLFSSILIIVDKTFNRSLFNVIEKKSRGMENG